MSPSSLSFSVTASSFWCATVLYARAPTRLPSWVCGLGRHSNFIGTWASNLPRRASQQASFFVQCAVNFAMIASQPRRPQAPNICANKNATLHPFTSVPFATWPSSLLSCRSKKALRKSFSALSYALLPRPVLFFPRSFTKTCGALGDTWDIQVRSTFLVTQREKSRRIPNTRSCSEYTRDTVRTFQQKSFAKKESDRGLSVSCPTSGQQRTDASARHQTRKNRDIQPAATSGQTPLQVPQASNHSPM